MISNAKVKLSNTTIFEHERSPITGSNNEIHKASNCDIIGHNNNIGIAIGCRITGNSNNIRSATRCIIRGCSNKVEQGDHTKMFGDFNEISGLSCELNVGPMSSTRARNTSPRVPRGELIGFRDTMQSYINVRSRILDRLFPINISENNLHRVLINPPPPVEVKTIKCTYPPRVTDTQPPEESTDKLCCICLTNSKCIASLPCGQLTMCISCSKELLRENPINAKCPLCAQVIESCGYIYM